MAESADKNEPVKGGDSLLSRARRLTTAAKFAPAEIPAAMNPSSGLPLKDAAFLATC